VSAVVLLSGPEGPARATLDAVRAQPEATLEILPVVMDQRLRPLADTAAEEDWRVRPGVLIDVDDWADDWARARELGSAAARTPWLLFLSPRQLILPGAVETLMAARGAEATVVLGELEGSAAPWSRNPLLGRLLVPHVLWARTVDDGEQDGQTAAVSLLVEGFSEAGRPTLRDDSSPRTRLFERVSNPLPALSARVAADRSMLAELEGDAHLRSARAAGALARDLPRFLLAVERCDESEWDLLRSHAAELADVAAESWFSTTVEDRTAAWLAAEGRRDALTEFVAARRFAGGAFATSAKDGVVLAQMDGVPDDVPVSLLRLDEGESNLRAQVRRMLREDDDLILEIFAGLRKVDQGGDFPEVGARLLGSGEPVDLPVEVSPDAAVTRWMGEPHQYHDYGVLTVRIPLRALSSGSWQLELDMQHSGVRRTGRVTELDGHGSAARTLSVGDRAVRWVWTPEGVRLVVTDEQPPAPHGAVVRRFETAPGRLVLEVDAPAGATTALLAPGQAVPGTPDGSQRVFELTTDPWKLGPAPAPTGSYRLAVTADGTELPVTLAEEVCDRLPFNEVDELHRKALWRGPHGGLVLRLDPPLGDQAAGPWSQHQLQRSYRAVSEPLDSRLVYFQSFLGQSPTDHPAAIQAELHRVLGERDQPGVRMLWAVMDSSTRVPDGAEPVLLRSREWYDALARAAWVVTNIELDPWFTRREGQEVLETYHGYPSKAMGLAQWRARGLTPTHQQQMLRRTSGSWNNLLTPIPEMDRHYRETYEFAGRIISQGYPRQDALVAPGHEQRRAATRERLGIAPHQKAVIYAPTWRDDLATNFRSAQAVLHLSVDRAAQALGPDYVILLRGHRFHSPAGHGAQVIDVTGYPEVNDLILAADAAVLDYSSLRFDFALTGHPMVFLVPDLKHYTEETRGFLYDFADSAPGPLVDSTMEVVEALADLPALEREWSPRISEFNAHYNRLADGRAAERVVAEFFAPLLG
jgi:CDP-glycerol glycerophosphotransferase (TagB/SpsB family)